MFSPLFSNDRYLQVLFNNKIKWTWYVSLPVASLVLIFKGYSVHFFFFLNLKLNLYCDNFNICCYLVFILKIMQNGQGKCNFFFENFVPDFTTPQILFSFTVNVFIIYLFRLYIGSSLIFIYMKIIYLFTK